jgi:hypothetical protein
MASLPVRYSSSRGRGGTTSRPVGYGTSSPLSQLLQFHAGPSGYVPPAITDQYAATPEVAGIKRLSAAPPSFQSQIPQGPADQSHIGGFDLSTDPILQRVIAYGRQQVEQAQAGADAAAKQALINSGFGDVARKYRFGGPADELLGLGDTTAVGDVATAQAAEANPYSVAALLGKAHAQQNVGIDQNQNLQNLFFSSNRANLLGDEAQNYLGRTYGAQQDLASQLSGIAQNLIAARQAAEQSVLGESENAYLRALQNAQFASPTAPAAPTALPSGYVPPAGPNIQLTDAFKRAIAGYRTGL